MYGDAIFFGATKRDMAKAIKIVKRLEATRDEAKELEYIRELQRKRTEHLAEGVTA